VNLESLDRLLNYMVVDPSTPRVPAPLNWQSKYGNSESLRARLRASELPVPPSLSQRAEVWERLESQLQAYLYNEAFDAAVWLCRKHLGIHPHNLFWEGGTPGTRLWVRLPRKQGILPLPQSSFVEGVVWTWWGLHGGYYYLPAVELEGPWSSPSKPSNFGRHLTPWLRPGDGRRLRAHPCLVPFNARQWRPPRKQIVHRDGIVAWGDSEPIGRLRSPSVFAEFRPADWQGRPDMAYGLTWLERTREHVGDALYHEALRLRLRAV
jgi:hypothetical protein